MIDDQMRRHPSTLDHSPDELIRLAMACLDASHQCRFDDLQSAANALLDWAHIRSGGKLFDLDGVEYPLEIGRGGRQIVAARRGRRDRAAALDGVSAGL